MTLPQRIKADRESRKMTQTEYGKIVGISYSYLSNIESGRKQPTLETVNKLLKVLGVDSVEKLIENEFKKREL